MEHDHHHPNIEDLLHSQLNALEQTHNNNKRPQPPPQPDNNNKAQQFEKEMAVNVKLQQLFGGQLQFTSHAVTYTRTKSNNGKYTFGAEIEVAEGLKVTVLSSSNFPLICSTVHFLVTLWNFRSLQVPNLFDMVCCHFGISETLSPFEVMRKLQVTLSGNDRSTRKYLVELFQSFLKETGVEEEMDRRNLRRWLFGRDHSEWLKRFGDRKKSNIVQFRSVRKKVNPLVAGVIFGHDPYDSEGAAERKAMPGAMPTPDFVTEEVLLKDLRRLLNPEVEGAYQQLCNTGKIPKNMNTALIFYVANNLIKPVLERRTPKERGFDGDALFEAEDPADAFGQFHPNLKLLLTSCSLTDGDWHTMRTQGEPDSKRVSHLSNKVGRMVNAGNSIQQARFGMNHVGAIMHDPRREQVKLPSQGQSMHLPHMRRRVNRDKQVDADLIHGGGSAPFFGSSMFGNPLPSQNGLHGMHGAHAQGMVVPPTKKSRLV